MPSRRSSSRAARRPSTVRSVRLRAGLGLAVVAVPFALGVQGTFAFWSDNATINAGTFTAGTLDIQANGVDAYASTALPMSAMVPGNSSAELITIKNNGTAPLKYTLTGGLGGTDAAAYSTSTALRVSLSTGATVAGTGNARTCTGGTAVVTSRVLTTVTTTEILPRRPAAPLAAGASEVFCFQITFDDTTASNNQATLQGKSVTASFTAAATSDVS